MNDRPGIRSSGLRIAFLVHGSAGSVEAIRARELAAALPPTDTFVLHREGSRFETARAWRATLRTRRPDLAYVLNTALPGALLAPWLTRIHGIPYILDTGDAVYEMARDSGIEPRWRLPLLRLVEQIALRNARSIVVRGSRHQEYLRASGLPRVQLIRDGYLDPGAITPASVEALRTRFSLPRDRLVVGVLGSTVFSPRLRICYGWDLLEALGRLRDLPVHGLVIGDGDGLPWLREQAHRHQVTDRVTFAGRVPYADVQPSLRLFDFALSTQTNNLAGRVRTTGKLPEYMAAGRFVLASRVGDAERLLPEPMLVPFEGTLDTAYPTRLADRLREVHQRPDRESLAASLPERARAHCSYPVLRGQFLELLRFLPGLPSRPTA